jgi:hypothetical protein
MTGELAWVQDDPPEQYAVARMELYAYPPGAWFMSIYANGTLLNHRLLPSSWVVV